MRTETIHDSKPLVSIVTPVYNDVGYIERCILNVLNQSYHHIEHIIVDGMSTDGTLEILERYQDKYPQRIRFISEPDKGGDEAWNKGLKLATGEILGILGADDLFIDDAIESVVDFFSSNSNAKFVYGNHVTINEQGNIIEEHDILEFDFHSFVNSTRHICTTSAFYKAEVMEKIGWLDSSGDDFEVMIRIARHFKPFTINKVLSKFSSRPNSAFNSPSTFEALKKTRKQTFDVSRRYGGGLFSPLAIRYYAIVAVDFLHLVRFYPFFKKIYIKLIMPFLFSIYSKKNQSK